MLYVILATLCYLATSIFMKLASVRGLDAIEVNVSLRVFGTLLTVVLLVFSDTNLNQPHLATVGLIGIFSGVCTFLSGYACLRALDFGPMNTTWSVLRSATVIPILASIVVWGELRNFTEPRDVVLKLLGAGCLLGALVLLGRGPRG